MFNDLDEVLRKMGKVAKGLMADSLALAERSSEQMSDVGRTLVDPLGRSHIYGAASCRHAAIVWGWISVLGATAALFVGTFPSSNRG